MKWMANLFWRLLACILALALVAGTGVMAGVGEKTTHFSIKYSDSSALTPGIGRILEDSYRAVNGYFGNLPGSIKVVVIDGDAMDNIGKHVEAFSAWNHKSSTIVLRGETLKDKKSLGVVTKHEICHLALNDILEKKGEKGFAWLEEGTCMVVSKEPLDSVKMSRYIVSHGFMTLPEIAKAIDSDDYPVTKNGYLQSYSLCRYIVDRFGMKALVGIIKTPKSDFDSAFRQYAGTDFQTFYDQWKAWVEADARDTPSSQLVTIRGYLCLG